MKFIPLSGAFRLLFLLFILSQLSCTTTSQWKAADVAGNTEAKFMADIGYLADDKMEGRAFGSKGELLASH